MPSHVLASLESLTGETLIIAIVTLLLFGKELPTVSRKVGRALANFKAMLTDATSEISREMNAAARDVEQQRKDVNSVLRPPDTIIARKAAWAAQIKPPPPEAHAPGAGPLPPPQSPSPPAAPAPTDSATSPPAAPPDNAPPLDYQV